jgi:Flp pilus assembly protein TadD
MRKCLFLVVLLPLAAMATPQKPPPKSQIDILFSQLQAAQRPEDAQPIEQKIDAIFRQSGSASIDLLMSRANAALGQDDDKTARRLLDAVTHIAPDYAEGWHARARMQQAANDDAGAMVSLQKAVQRNGRDFSAMSDLADMLEDYGDKAGALKLYRRVLALDPQMEGAARHIKALSRDVEGQGI